MSLACGNRLSNPLCGLQALVTCGKCHQVVISRQAVVTDLSRLLQFSYLSVNSGSKSPDRAAKMMTNSYPFPQRSHNQQLIVNQVSGGGIFSKLNDSTSSKTKPHCARGSKPTPVGPPNPYRIPKLIPTDQPSTSGFQPCLSPLVDKKINNTQQLWKSKLVEVGVIYVKLQC